MVELHLTTISLTLFLILTGKEKLFTSCQETWPQGTYGLPKAKYGCPRSEEDLWKQGWRQQTLEHNPGEHGTELSNPFHIEATLDHSCINRTFCIKTGDSNQLVNKTWPQGSYCIYQYGVCPPGMNSGYIKWDDRNVNNTNKNSGLLPDGQYDGNTMINYCCQNQGQWNNSIELPNDQPFYLLPYERHVKRNGYPRCQRVKWAIAFLEYIEFDTENSNINNDQFVNHHVYSNQVKSLPKMYYCYFKGCRYKTANNSGTIASPRHPQINNYPDFQYCSWFISVNVKLVVSLNFTRMYIPDCNENSLYIYDGPNETSQLLKRYCGSNVTANASVVSSGNHILMVLKSGNHSQNSERPLGFRAEYRVQLKLDSSEKQSTSFLTVIIALPILALGILIIIVIIVTMFLRRRKKQGNSDSDCVKNIPAVNPSYEMRTNFAGAGKVLSSSIHLASSPTPQERVWQTNSGVCGKEGQNPVYEAVTENGLYEVYRSRDNITYETSYDMRRNQLESNQSEDQPIYSEPDISMTKKVDEYYDSANLYDHVGIVIPGKPK